MVLAKDDILNANDLPYKDVEVPEWGGTVRIRTMTGGERDAYEASIYDTSGDTPKLVREDFRAKLLAKVIINEKGERLFTDKDIKVLSAKSAKALDRLIDAARDLSGISKEEGDRIKNE